MPSRTPSTLTEKRLRRLLTSRRVEDAAELEFWLNPPAHHGRETLFLLLTKIARDAKSTQERVFGAASVWARSFAFSFCVYWVAFAYFRANYPGAQIDSALSGFVGAQMGVLLWPEIKQARRARGAGQAALVLARTGDTRAVQYLANLWTPCPLTRREAAFNADVSRTLTRLLGERQGSTYDRDTEKALRRMVSRAFPTRKKERLRRVLRRSLVLDETNTDVLLSVVRHLAPRPTSGTVRVEAELDQATLQQITSTPGTGEHYALLNETAAALLQRAQGRSR